MADLRSDRAGEVHLVSGILYAAGGELLTVKYAQTKATGSGDNTVVAAIASTIIRVLSYTLQAHGTVTAQFQDSTSTTLRGPEFDFEAREGVHATSEMHGLFETVSGKGVDLNLSGAVDVGVSVTYVEITT
ncbi:hypothetical protein LCGC14_2761790 [marine sediment metagenome]|uniref:Uncharacterized protein n=1 Tax=marine sediment metagenome TaxID=412755 RepID=A0A0F9B7C2_9ZZZZ